MTNTTLNDYIQSSPLVQAAITEAVHRFYHDRICSNSDKDLKDLEETQASDILNTLWNLQPNWRFVLAKAAKRYGVDSPDTNAVAVCGKPKEIINLKIEIEIK